MKKLTYYLLGIILLFTFCKTTTNKMEMKESDLSDQKTITLSDSQLSFIKIKTAQIQQKTISNTISLTGRVEILPQDIYNISVPFGGYIKSLNLLVGQYVKKGQILAILEDQKYIQLQQDYLVAQSKLYVKEEEYLRQQDLFENNATTAKIFKQSKSDFESSKIELRAIAESLKMISIDVNTVSDSTITSQLFVRSPISGYVSKIGAVMGQYVTASDLIFEILNPNRKHLQLTVLEKDLPFITIGQKVLAYNINNPQKQYPCTIFLVGRDLSPNRTAKVHCHFQRKNTAQLFPGMYMNAEVQSNSIKKWVIDEKAIVTFEGINYVFIQKSNNEFEMLEIKTGAQNEEWIEILNPDNLINKNIVFEEAYTLLMALKNIEEE